MSGITPATTPVIPNYETDGTAFAVHIGHAINAMARLGFAFAPFAQATPNMTVALAAGHIPPNLEVAAQSTGTIAAPTTHPRKDLIVIDNATGAVSVVTGTEAASPVVPALPSGKSRVAEVTLTVWQTSITAADVADVRGLGLLGIIVGTNEGNLVGVLAGGKLPALSGELLTNLPATGADLAALTAMLLWRYNSKGSGTIPLGYLHSLQTDEMSVKTGAAYDAAWKTYTNRTASTVTETASATGAITAAWTYINTDIAALTGGQTLTKIGAYQSSAAAGAIMVLKYVSGTTWDVVYSQDVSHPGGGWA